MTADECPNVARGWGHCWHETNQTNVSTGPLARKLVKKYACCWCPTGYKALYTSQPMAGHGPRAPHVMQKES